MNSMIKNILALTTCLFIYFYCFNVYGYQIINGKFVSSHPRLSFKMPSSKFSIRPESGSNIYAVALETTSCQSCMGYIIVMIPLDEEHFRGLKSYTKKDFDLSLPYRIKRLAQEKGSKIETMNCKNILENKKNAYRCEAKDADNNFLVGTLFKANKHALYVYGINPVATNPFDYRAYNDFLSSINVN